ncbi:serine hydrolase domain-containing protein [Microbacterium flavum]|uniref:Beta-lactamase family protein n=1 Tax=Microbacterium flavum TaxID=415216 RepID=A0ABS5XV03_9MICO|nr:serine hydrolase domain-containing protein [Microbacterium flavum]MBT8798365.1 beta-lactamase family protein [Microbacterium flavum]
MPESSDADPNVHHAALEAALTDAARRRAPGGMAAVIESGEVRAALAFGEPRRDGTPTTARTVFRIASLTKSFLAATALSLREDGLLELGAPVSEYVPAMGAARFRGAPARITLADLLANRSGLPEDNPWGDDHLGASRSEIMEIITSGLQLSASPGTLYQYSNIGMSMIGRAIEAVTERPVERVIDERILGPLGLTNTRWTADAFGRDADVARGFRTFDDGATFIPAPSAGSGALACIGSLFSTADDIARWMGFLIDGFDDRDPDGGRAVLSSAARRELQRLHTVNPTRATRFGGRELVAAGYGYGLVVEHDVQFGRTVGHAGGLPGFAAHMRWHPESGLGVVAFGNSDEFPAWQVTASALDHLLSARTAASPWDEVWAATREAARTIDDVIRERRSFADAGALFSRNVLQDIPVEVRDRRLSALFDTLGTPIPDAPPVASRVVSAPEASTLRWDLPTEHGALRCEVHMMGLSVPIVQAISVGARDQSSI